MKLALVVFLALLAIFCAADLARAIAKGEPCGCGNPKCCVEEPARCTCCEPFACLQHPSRTK